MKTKIFVFFLVFLLCFVLGCQKKAEKAEAQPAPMVNLEAEKAAVKAVVDQFMQGMKTEDMEIFSSIIAHDPDMQNFGTDAAEIWVGWDSLKESFERQFQSMDVENISTKDQVIKVHKSGEVAWFSEILDFSGKTQGEPFSIEGFRLSGTLEKQAGNWIIVQFHASVPVSGQVVKY
jgi:ketosteroid isomerase-like protein